MLVLYNCKGADVNGYEMLKSVMNAGKLKFVVLYLSDNEINTGGDTFIATFLAKNPILATLDVTRNELNDDDAGAIAIVLRRNSELRTLNISRNNLTNEGWEALGKAVFDKTSLNSAADSNHTCNIDFPDDDDYDDVRQINGDISSDKYLDPDYVRQKKIYKVLSDRNRNRSNVEHFDEDMQVELLPDMLQLIEEYSNYHIVEIGEEEVTPPQDTQDIEPLSIMFEILQRWDKSLAVFEAFGSQSSVR